MLKLTDDGAKITLQGQPAALDNRLFWFGAALLVGAVLVAIAMSLLPVRWSIGALALLIIGSFIFNQQRQKQKQAQLSHINHGILWVRQGELVHDHQGKRAHIQLAEGDTILLEGANLQIMIADIHHSAANKVNANAEAVSDTSDADAKNASSSNDVNTDKRSHVAKSAVTQRCYQLSGFESEQEAKVTKAILQGEALTKRHAKIKMQGN